MPRRRAGCATRPRRLRCRDLGPAGGRGRRWSLRRLGSRSHLLSTRIGTPLRTSQERVASTSNRVWRSATRQSATARGDVWSDPAHGGAEARTFATARSSATLRAKVRSKRQGGLAAQRLCSPSYVVDEITKHCGLLLEDGAFGWGARREPCPKIHDTALGLMDPFHSISPNPPDDGLLYQQARLYARILEHFLDREVRLHHDRCDFDFDFFHSFSYLDTRRSRGISVSQVYERCP